MKNGNGDDNKNENGMKNGNAKDEIGIEIEWSRKQGGSGRGEKGDEKINEQEWSKKQERTAYDLARTSAETNFKQTIIEVK